MRKVTNLLSALLILLCSCASKENQFRIDGHVAGFDSDTILIYPLGADSAKVDTIPMKGGAFSYAATVDTLSAYVMLFPPCHHYLVFADKDLTVTIKGDSASMSRLDIAGGSLNEVLTAFRQSLSDLPEEVSALKADSFIRANPYSYASVYVLHRYLLTCEKPDYAKVQSAITAMSGELQDLSYVKALTDPLRKQLDISEGKRVPTFSLKNGKGETVSLNNARFREKHVLLNFWASWSAPSRQENEMMKRLKKKYKNKNIEFVGISLDYDKEQWNDVIEKDTLDWEQLCDFDSWEGTTAQQYGVKALPYSVLINQNKTIIAKDLSEEELITKLDGILKTSSQTKKKK